MKALLSVANDDGFERTLQQKQVALGNFIFDIPFNTLKENDKSIFIKVTELPGTEQNLLLEYSLTATPEGQSILRLVPKSVQDYNDATFSVVKNVSTSVIYEAAVKVAYDEAIYEL